jgi:hypothetical protein
MTSGSLGLRALCNARGIGFKDCGLAMVFPDVPRRRHAAMRVKITSPIFHINEGADAGAGNSFEPAGKSVIIDLHDPD